MESKHPPTCACSNTFNTSNLTAPLGTPECLKSLDNVLNVRHEATELWPRLQACAVCFPKTGKGRGKDLLIIYDKVVGVLSANADVFLSRRDWMASTEKLTNESVTGSVSRVGVVVLSSAAPARAVSGRALQTHAKINVPSVLLGEFRLCQEQVEELLGYAYRDVLGNLAMVLCDIRRVSRHTRWEDLNDLADRILHRVLNLLKYTQ